MLPLPQACLPGIVLAVPVPVFLLLPDRHFVSGGDGPVCVCVGVSVGEWV